MLAKSSNFGLLMYKEGADQQITQLDTKMPNPFGSSLFPLFLLKTHARMAKLSIHVYRGGDVAEK